MRVTLLAATQFFSYAGFAATDKKFLSHPYVGDAANLVEFAGRACYQSWDRPNPDTASSPGYLANIIAQGHFSVLEHASATFYITGVSRSLTHELIRHRHLSYSQLSQRFVDESEVEFVVPPAIRDVVNRDPGIVRRAEDTWGEVWFFDTVRKVYRDLVEDLEAEGLSRKQVREAARSILPNCTETRIVVTGNHRAWRDMLQKRYSVHADAEIRELATELLRQLRRLAPGIYQDFPEEPFE